MFVDGLVIPALIQATATKQFDVIMTAVIGIPPAIAVARMSTAAGTAAAGVPTDRAKTRVAVLRSSSSSDGVVAAGDSAAMGMACCSVAGSRSIA